MPSKIFIALFLIMGTLTQAEDWDGEAQISGFFIGSTLNSSLTSPLSITYSNPNDDKSLYYKFGVDLEFVKILGLDDILPILIERSPAYWIFSGGVDHSQELSPNLFWLKGGSLGLAMIDGTGTRIDGNANYYINLQASTHAKYYFLDFTKWYGMALGAGLKLNYKVPLGGEFYNSAPAFTICPNLSLSF